MITTRQLTGARRAADVQALLGEPAAAPPTFLIEQAEDPATLRAYYTLRHQAFVHQQNLFTDTDQDHHDEDPRTLVLVARDRSGTVIGGVRLGPATPGPDLGWWQGGRLVSRPGCRCRWCVGSGGLCLG